MFKKLFTLLFSLNKQEKFVVAGLDLSDLSDEEISDCLSDNSFL